MYGPVGAPCSGYPPADHSFYQGKLAQTPPADESLAVSTPLSHVHDALCLRAAHSAHVWNETC